MLDGCGMGVLCKSFWSARNGVVCVRGVEHGGGLLAPNLASLSVDVLQGIYSVCRILGGVRRVVCCASCQVIVCMSSLSGWLYWKEGWRRWL